MNYLSDHLKCLSTLRIPVSQAGEGLREQLLRFGRLEETQLPDWASISNYLIPLKSFPTRYVVLGINDWTFLLNDMRWETCHVDILSISKAFGCSGVTVCFREDSRQFHLVEDGKETRSVVCYEDGGKWFFHETGEAATFEDVELYSKRSVRERLMPEIVCEYFTAATGLTAPVKWRACGFTDAMGIERSTQDLKVTITRWETSDDT